MNTEWEFLLVVLRGWLSITDHLVTTTWLLQLLLRGSRPTTLASPKCNCCRARSTMRHCPTAVGQDVQLQREQTDLDFTVGQCITHTRFLSGTTHCLFVLRQRLLVDLVLPMKLSSVHGREHITFVLKTTALAASKTANRLQKYMYTPQPHTVITCLSSCCLWSPDVIRCGWLGSKH